MMRQQTVVVIFCKTNHTERTAKSFSAGRKESGRQNARNLGAEKASGEYFVFCDAHMLFADGWLDLLLEPLEKKLTDATTPAIGSVNNPEFTGYGQTLKFNLRIKWNDKQNRLFETAVLPGACFAVPEKFSRMPAVLRGVLKHGVMKILNSP